MAATPPSYSIACARPLSEAMCIQVWGIPAVAWNTRIHVRMCSCNRRHVGPRLLFQAQHGQALRIHETAVQKAASQQAAPQAGVPLSGAPPSTEDARSAELHAIADRRQELLHAAGCEAGRLRCRDRAFISGHCAGPAKCPSRPLRLDDSHAKAYGLNGFSFGLLVQLGAPPAFFNIIWALTRKFGQYSDETHLQCIDGFAEEPQLPGHLDAGWIRHLGAMVPPFVAIRIHHALGHPLLLLGLHLSVHLRPFGSQRRGHCIRWHWAPEDDGRQHNGQPVLPHLSLSHCPWHHLRR